MWALSRLDLDRATSGLHCGPMRQTASPSLQQTIARATELSREVKALSAELEEHKAKLRKAGEKLAERKDIDEMIEFECDSGDVATVVFVKDAFSPIPGANLRELESALAGETWDDLLEERVVMKDDFGEKFERLDKSVQKQLSKYVERKPRDPRVTLPR